MTPVSQGKPCAGNPHARFEGGASAPEEPRRKALLHSDYLIVCLVAFPVLYEAKANNDQRLQTLSFELSY